MTEDPVGPRATSRRSPCKQGNVVDCEAPKASPEEARKEKERSEKSRPEAMHYETHGLTPR